ncbi:MAG TPA: sugar transferase [Actinomycetota bacterium]|nr:sugar transferase [Actinomycetota bacterium]
MAALRKLEIEVPARGRVSPRPLVLSLVPALDAAALLVAVIVSAGDPVFIAAAVLTFLVLNVDTSRAYRLDPRVGHEMGWLLGRLGVPLLLLVWLASLDLTWLEPVRDLDRLVLAGSLGAVMVLTGRAVAYAISRAAKARRIISERALVVGTGPVGVGIAMALERHPEFGLDPIGFIDGPTAEELPYPLLGGPHDLERVVEDFDVHRIVVAFGRGKDRDMATLLRSLETLRIEVHIVPRFFELGSIPHGAADDLRGIPLVHLRRPAFRALPRASKRVFDVVVSTFLLILLSPILLASAVAVKTTSAGPVLFRQLRVGKRGAPFEMLKFRTMTVDDASEPSWTIEHHRVTKVGKVLRRTSIDELPQLFNVLRGDMSLVGPRPEQPHFAEAFSASVPTYADRTRVEGGITGLAQVHGRSRDIDSIPERARFDNSYIENRSLWGDILILFRTLEVLFRGDRS